MRILWLLNICPPAVGKALGLECSVREGWITGALNRFLAEDGDGKGAEEMELGICFPVDPLSGTEISEKRRLYPLTAGQSRPAEGQEPAGKRQTEAVLQPAGAGSGGGQRGLALWLSGGSEAPGKV